MLEHSNRFIACSRAVAENLKRHGVLEDRIDLVHEFIPIGETEPFNKDEQRRWLREILGIPEDAFVVAGSGVLGWRKGSDLFIQVASYVRQHRPDLNLHFLWLGGTTGTWSSHEFLHDVELLKLTDYVTLAPTQENPLSYFSGIDIFLLPSREDPYPLVCLETAAFRVPIICFEGAGGMPEFIEADCGSVTPYLDVIAMASEVIRLAENADERISFGRCAARKVRSRHDIAIAAPMILAAMQKTMEPGR